MEKVPKKKTLQYQYILEWTNRVFNGDDKSNMVCTIVEDPALNLDYKRFKSYILRNSGSPVDIDNVMVSYLHKDKQNFIDSQEDFENALVVFRRRAISNENIYLKLEYVNCINCKRSPQTIPGKHDVDVQVEKSSVAQQPPEWFLTYMNEFKKQLIDEVSAAVQSSTQVTSPLDSPVSQNDSQLQLDEDPLENNTNLSTSSLASANSSEDSQDSSDDEKEDNSLPIMELSEENLRRAEEAQQLYREFELVSPLQVLAEMDKNSDTSEESWHSDLMGTVLAMSESQVSRAVDSLFEKRSSTPRLMVLREMNHRENDLTNVGNAGEEPDQDTFCDLNILVVSTQTSHKHIVSPLAGDELLSYVIVVLNNGKVDFTADTVLRYAWGSQALQPLNSEIPCPILKSTEGGLMEIIVKVPKIPGSYECYWHFHHRGIRFGNSVDCTLTVEDYPVKLKNYVPNPAYDVINIQDDYELVLPRTLTSPRKSDSSFEIIQSDEEIDTLKLSDRSLPSPIPLVEVVCTDCKDSNTRKEQLFDMLAANPHAFDMDPSALDEKREIRKIKRYDSVIIENDKFNKHYRWRRYGGPSCPLLERSDSDSDSVISVTGDGDISNSKPADHTALDTAVVASVEVESNNPVIEMKDNISDVSLSSIGDFPALTNVELNNTTSELATLTKPVQYIDLEANNIEEQLLEAMQDILPRKKTVEQEESSTLFERGEPSKTVAEASIEEACCAPKEEPSAAMINELMNSNLFNELANMLTPCPPGNSEEYGEVAVPDVAQNIEVSRMSLTTEDISEILKTPLSNCNPGSTKEYVYVTYKGQKIPVAKHYLREDYLQTAEEVPQEVVQNIDDLVVDSFLRLESASGVKEVQNVDVKQNSPDILLPFTTKAQESKNVMQNTEEENACKVVVETRLERELLQTTGQLFPIVVQSRDDLVVDSSPSQETATGVNEAQNDVGVKRKSQHTIPASMAKSEKSKKFLQNREEENASKMVAESRSGKSLKRRPPKRKVDKSNKQERGNKSKSCGEGRSEVDTKVNGQMMSRSQSSQSSVDNERFFVFPKQFPGYEVVHHFPKATSVNSSFESTTIEEHESVIVKVYVLYDFEERIGGDFVACLVPAERANQDPLQQEESLESQQYCQLATPFNVKAWLDGLEPVNDLTKKYIMFPMQEGIVGMNCNNLQYAQITLENIYTIDELRNMVDQYCKVGCCWTACIGNCHCLLSINFQLYFIYEIRAFTVVVAQNAFNVRPRNKIPEYNLKLQAPIFCNSPDLLIGGVGLPVPQQERQQTDDDGLAAFLKLEQKSDTKSQSKKKRDKTLVASENRATCSSTITQETDVNNKQATTKPRITVHRIAIPFDQHPLTVSAVSEAAASVGEKVHITENHVVLSSNEKPKSFTNSRNPTDKEDHVTEKQVPVAAAPKAVPDSKSSAKNVGYTVPFENIPKSTSDVASIATFFMVDDSASKLDGPIAKDISCSEGSASNATKHEITITSEPRALFVPDNLIMKSDNIIEEATNVTLGQEAAIITTTWKPVTEKVHATKIEEIVTSEPRELFIPDDLIMFGRKITKDAANVTLGKEASVVTTASKSVTEKADTTKIEETVTSEPRELFIPDDLIMFRRKIAKDAANVTLGEEASVVTTASKPVTEKADTAKIEETVTSDPRELFIPDDLIMFRRKVANDSANVTLGQEASIITNANATKNKITIASVPRALFVPDDLIMKSDNITGDTSNVTLGEEGAVSITASKSVIEKVDVSKNQVALKLAPVASPPKPIAANVYTVEDRIISTFKQQATAPALLTPISIPKNVSLDGEQQTSSSSESSAGECTPSQPQGGVKRKQTKQVTVASPKEDKKDFFKGLFVKVKESAGTLLDDLFSANPQSLAPREFQEEYYWSDGPWNSANHSTEREQSLRILHEMGFKNRELNTTLLAQFHDDFNNTLAELLSNHN